MFGAAVKVLAVRVSGLEKTTERHLVECAELARQNLQRVDQLLERMGEILDRSNANAAACIKTAEEVRDSMNRTFLRAAFATIGMLAAVLGTAYHLHL